MNRKWTIAFGSVCTALALSAFGCGHNTSNPNAPANPGVTNVQPTDNNVTPPPQAPNTYEQTPPAPVPNQYQNRGNNNPNPVPNPNNNMNNANPDYAPNYGQGPNYGPGHPGTGWKDGGM